MVDNTSYQNYKTNTVSGCGFNLLTTAAAAALTQSTEVPVNVTVALAAGSTPKPADAALPSYKAQTMLTVVPPSAVTSAARTITFTNNSSRYVVFAANSGTATAYVSPTTTAGSGVVGCGTSAPAQACPIGSTCVQGGQDVGPTTPYQCFWDAPAFASNPVAPASSATASVPGFAGVTSGSQQIQWSGSYYALNCPGGANATGCPAAPTTPGTSPPNPAQTVAEVTYQHNAVDFYDVSIINGVSNALALGPSAASGKAAGSAVPGGQGGSITTPYACGTAGSATAQTGTGATDSAYTLPASTWALAPTAANFPAPVADSPASYYAVVNPSNKAAPTVCSAQGTCSSSTTGDTVCGWNANYLSQASGNQRVCGAFQQWASANQLWGWNQTAGNAGNTVFGFATGNASGVTVGQLQLCTNPAATIYSTYATQPPSTDTGPGLRWHQLGRRQHRAHPGGRPHHPAGRGLHHCQPHLGAVRVPDDLVAQDGLPHLLHLPLRRPVVHLQLRAGPEQPGHQPAGLHLAGGGSEEQLPLRPGPAAALVPRVSAQAVQ